MTADDREWMVDALCRGYPEVDFHPVDSFGVLTAQKFCRKCPVIGECLEYALERDERFGIWGGLSERERRRIRGKIPSAIKSRFKPSILKHISWLWRVIACGCGLPLRRQTRPRNGLAWSCMVRPAQ